MFCPKCGTPANENQSHCTNCGAPLNAQQQVYQQQYNAPYNAPANKSVPGLGLAVTSMVLGIVSVVLFCIIYVAIPCAIVGIALGGVALLKAKRANVKSGMAIAGITCSCVALGILIILAVAIGAEIASWASFINSL